MFQNDPFRALPSDRCAPASCGVVPVDGAEQSALSLELAIVSECINGIRPDDAVDRDQCQVVFQRLANQHPVEWVAVQVRQRNPALYTVLAER